MITIDTTSLHTVEWLAHDYLSHLRHHLKQITWPDITENFIRDFALQNGLVNIKVCAVNDTWPGLKLIIPVKDK